MSADVEALFERARSFCLSLDNVYEKLSHGSPAFFIEKGGQFASLWNNHHSDGNIALLLAAPPGVQESLIGSDEAVFYRPPYVGPSGWIGIRLDKTDDWALIEDLIREGHGFIAAKCKNSRK